MIIGVKLKGGDEDDNELVWREANCYGLVLESYQLINYFFGTYFFKTYSSQMTSN